MSKAGLRKINVKTGEVVWTSRLEVDDLPGLRKGYAPILLTADKKTAYVPHDKTIDAINLSDGTVLWKKGPKLLSKARQMELTAGGLVLKGGGVEKEKPYITVIDPQTGAPMWKKPFRDLEGASSFAIKDDKIVLYADGSIFLINISDATATEIAKKIKFDGGEIPNSVELKDNGYLLISDQNIAQYDAEGKQVFHAFHKAPGSSLFAKIASTAAITALNAASAASAYGQAQSTGMDQKYSLVTGQSGYVQAFQSFC